MSGVSRKIPAGSSLRVHRASARKKFRKYKNESEKKVKKITVKEDETFKQLKKAWGRLYVEGYATDVVYEKALELTAKIKYSSKDVEKFSIALCNFKKKPQIGGKAGLFLSALINNGEDSDYTIHTSHLEDLSSIGYKNVKNIRVIGDAGDMCGDSMKKGRISVEGNAGSGIGDNMLGGTIEIRGNCPDCGNNIKGGEIIIEGSIIGYVWALTAIKGGRIIVRGDVECEQIGNCMEAGEIRIGGELYGNISKEIDGGKIFHKGKLIVDK